MPAKYSEDLIPEIEDAAETLSKKIDELDGLPYAPGHNTKMEVYDMVENRGWIRNTIDCFLHFLIRHIGCRKIGVCFDFDGRQHFIWTRFKDVKERNKAVLDAQDKYASNGVTKEMSNG